MNFKEAFAKMKQGNKVKLPSWGGYWYWDSEKETIMIQCRSEDSDQGALLDIRDTQRVEYTMMNMQSDDWMIADSKNCPVLGGEATFSFGDAIKYMKRGFRVKRQGWNGKNQYIQLAAGISYKSPEGDIVNCEHEAIGPVRLAEHRRHRAVLQRCGPSESQTAVCPYRCPQSAESVAGLT